MDCVCVWFCGDIGGDVVRSGTYLCDVVRTPERGVSEALATQSVGVRGFACEAGVSGWRPKTPTGLSGDGLPSKDNVVFPKQRGTTCVGKQAFSQFTTIVNK